MRRSTAHSSCVYVRPVGYYSVGISQYNVLNTGAIIISLIFVNLSALISLFYHTTLCL